MHLDEHDQAMAAYRTATRMLQGCHIPPLCVGMELIRVHNLSLAAQFVRSQILKRTTCFSVHLLINTDKPSSRNL